MHCDQSLPVSTAPRNVCGVKSAEPIDHSQRIELAPRYAIIMCVAVRSAVLDAGSTSHLFDLRVLTPGEVMLRYVS